MSDKERSDAGRELSKFGASKGGRARAAVLSAEERRQIARAAVQARWVKAGKPLVWQEPPEEPEEDLAPSLPYSLYRGTLPIGEIELECHVLDDGRRVLTQRQVVRVLSGGRESGNLSRYLERNPIFGETFDPQPIQFFVPPAPRPASGYEGTLLIEICEGYLEARDRGLLKPSQLKMARMAETIIRACAKVGIVALIDEATGYQEVRSKNQLRLKLQAIIADDMQNWERMFPEEFWLELARLEGIRYSPRSRPIRWGKYVMAFVYDAVDSDVGRELRAINPNPHHRKNHHQWLKKFGRERVNNQLQQVIAVMKLCDDMSDFERKFAHVFKKQPLQLAFDDLWRA